MTVVDEIVEAALSKKNYMSRVLKKQEYANSYGKLFKNMPFKNDTTMVGISSNVEIVNQILESDQGATQREQSISNNDIYVFAGYLSPGKHEVVIHDIKSNKYYAREFIVDVRKSNVL